MDYRIKCEVDVHDVDYNGVSAYGHFGKEEFPWERTDRINDLKKYL